MQVKMKFKKHISQNASFHKNVLQLTENDLWMSWISW